MIFSTPPISGPMQTHVAAFLKDTPVHQDVDTDAPSQKALVVMDNFSCHKTTSLLEELEEQGIVVVMVPAATEVQTLSAISESI